MKYMKIYHFDQTDTRKYQKHIENEIFAGEAGDHQKRADQPVAQNRQF